MRRNLCPKKGSKPEIEELISQIVKDYEARFANKVLVEDYFRRNI